MAAQCACLPVVELRGLAWATTFADAQQLWSAATNAQAGDADTKATAKRTRIVLSRRMLKESLSYELRFQEIAGVAEL